MIWVRRAPSIKDEAYRNLKCKRIQCDEIWSFCGAKEKNASREKKRQGWGDVWTWTALCPGTKLIPCWFVGDRSASSAYHFMHDLAPRLASRVQMTTDGHRAYLEAVEDAFGAAIDFAQLVKIYGNTNGNGVPVEVRYSPAQCMGARKAIISGTPDLRHVSTSYVSTDELKRAGTKYVIQFEQSDGSVRTIEHTWIVEPQ